MQKYIIFILLISLNFLLFSCGNDTETNDVIENLVLDVKVLNAETQQIEIDNFNHSICIEFARGVDVSNIEIQIDLAQGVTMITPNTPIATFDFTKGNQSFTVKKNNTEIIYRFIIKYYSSSSDFKIISYNILEGFQQQIPVQTRYLNWVNKINPQIAGYQEMNSFTQTSLKNFATKYNHPYALIAKEQGYPVAVTSKYPLVNSQKVFKNMYHGYIYTNINNIHIFVVHLCPSDYRIRQKEVQTILAHAATLPQNEPILIMGDFNSMARSDSIYYDANMIESLRNYEKQHPELHNLNNNNIDYTVTDQMIKAGYIDTYWLTNTTFKYSFPAPKGGSSNFRRIDFIWANPVIAAKVVKADIIHDEDTHTISDHYPAYLELNLE